jgi:hypothetical protein
MKGTPKSIKEPYKHTQNKKEDVRIKKRQNTKTN